VPDSRSDAWSWLEEIRGAFLPISRLMKAIVCGLLILSGGTLCAQNERVPGWQPEVREEWYLSSGDGTRQPTLSRYDPGVRSLRRCWSHWPTWGGSYKQAEPAYAEWCIRKGWVFVPPIFAVRIPKPSACGSGARGAGYFKRGGMGQTEDVSRSEEDLSDRGIRGRLCLDVNGWARTGRVGRGASVARSSDSRDWHTKHRGGPYGRAIEAACRRGSGNGCRCG